MRRTVTLAALLTALAAPAAGQADEAAVRRDLRCVLVVGIIGGQAQTTPEVRQGMMAGMGYYLGRLKGRDPAIDLTARLSAEARSLKLSDLIGEAGRCGEELKAFGQESQRVGAALQALSAEVGKTAT